MRRSLLYYTRLLVLPLFAVGMVLTGCDSGGSNGGSNGDDNGSDPSTSAKYPAPSSGNGYAEEIAINIQSADLGIRLEGSNPSESTLEAIYKGNQGSVGGESIQLTSSAVSPSATTYGGLSAFGDIESRISTDDLFRSGDLVSPDSDNPGTARDADELISYYLYNNTQSGWPTDTTSNGVDLAQLSEKGVAGALTYAEAADILNDFADDGSVSSGNTEEEWNEAFGHFGAPRNFKAVLDVGGGGNGLTSGPSGGKFQDIDGNNTTNLVTEGVYIWAGYTAERAAAAEATGNTNNFAARAFDAFVGGRKAIDNGNTGELSGSDGFAAKALQAWEETVAVNVIHYVNGMQSATDQISGEITAEKLNEASNASSAGFQDSWGEAKAFAWTLQFNDTRDLSKSELETIHDLIGNDPPYSEGVDASTYKNDLEEVKDDLETAYGFNSTNVDNW